MIDDKIANYILISNGQYGVQWVALPECHGEIDGIDSKADLQCLDLCNEINRISKRDTFPVCPYSETYLSSRIPLSLSPF